MREVPLTDEQFKLLKSEFGAKKQIVRMVTTLLMQLAEQITDDEEETWEQVYKLASANENQKVSINWLRKCLVVSDEGENEEKSD